MMLGYHLSQAVQRHMKYEPLLLNRNHVHFVFESGDIVS